MAHNGNEREVRIKYAIKMSSSLNLSQSLLVSPVLNFVR